MYISAASDPNVKGILKLVFWFLCFFSVKFFYELTMENGGAPQAEKTEKQVNDRGQIEVANSPFRMASVDRVSKLPVVEETVKMVNTLYGKVRVSNNLVNTAYCCENNIILLDSILSIFICSIAITNRMLDTNLYSLFCNSNTLYQFTYSHFTYFTSFALNM